MGLPGFWPLVKPVARPVSLEELRNQRLAVDASLWLYHFTKAIKDPQATDILAGFFRRLCKLLFYGIRPVFVFDGGVPSLKRETIRKRKLRQAGESQREQVLAKRIVKAKMKEHALKQLRTGAELDTVNKMMPKQKKPRLESDEYALPPINADNMVGDEELESDDEEEGHQSQYFHHPSSDNEELYFENIDTEAFKQLPIDIQGELIADLRQRSRQRRQNRHQLESVQEAQDFSQFQIQGLVKRNELWRKLDEIQGKDDGDVRRRIATEKNREYILTKNMDDSTWTLKTNKMEEKNDAYLLGEGPPKIPSDATSPKADSDTIASQPLKAKVEFLEKWRKLCAYPSEEIYKFMEFHLFDASEDERKDALESVLKKFGKSAVSSSAEELERIIFKKCFLEELMQFDGKVTGDKKEALEDSDEEEFFEVEAEHQDERYVFEELDSSSHSKKTLNESQRRVHDENFTGKTTDAFQEISVEFSELTKEPRSSDAIGTDADEAYVVIKENEQKGIIIAGEDIAKNRSLDETAHAHNETDIVTTMYQKSASCTDERDLDSTTSVDKSNNKRNFVLTENDLLDDDVSESIPEVQILSESNPPHENATVLGEKIDQETIIKVKEMSKALIDSEVTNAISLDEPMVSETLENDSDFNDVPLEDQVEIKSSLEPNLPKSSINIEIANAISLNEPESTDHEAPETEESDFNEESQDFVDFMGRVISNKTTLDEIQKDLMSSVAQLSTEHRRAQRDATAISADMIDEVKSLLTLFGVPFVVAPMEAEAQCCALEELNLVDGIITDDSDAFLFGAKQVYKNFFNKKQSVELYESDDLQEIMGLSRDHLIQVAYLVGSDYTEGIHGVGMVTALEIIAEWRGSSQEGGISKLIAFSEWWRNLLSGQAPEHETTSAREKLRKAAIKKWVLEDDFPRQDIYDAYKHPQVDQTDREFTWGFPDLDLIHQFFFQRLRWDQSKVDSYLVPIIRSMSQHRMNQSKIQQYFKKSNASALTDVAFKPRVSSVIRRLCKQLQTTHDHSSS